MRAGSLLLLFFAAVFAACGDAGRRAGPSSPEPPPAAACVGPIPANALPCPAERSSLTVDTSRFLTPACAGVPCSYACFAGHVLALGVCVEDPATPLLPAQLVDIGDGTLEDVATGLRWLRRPACAETIGGIARPGGALPFLEAKNWIGALASGACGLSDGSGPATWRLPSERELLGLVGASGAAFEAAPAGAAWSSLEPCTTSTVTIDPFIGEVAEHPKGEALPSWPVRSR